MEPVTVASLVALAGSLLVIAFMVTKVKQLKEQYRNVVPIKDWRRERERLLYVERITGQGLKAIMRGTNDPTAQATAQFTIEKAWGTFEKRVRA